MMESKIYSVRNLPSHPDEGSIFEIENSNVSYLTHNLFKYPCKYIPQIPGWAIDEYLETSSSRLVHDPFSGSGTTLTEAVLRGHMASGSDIDPFSRLLSSVKATPLSREEIEIGEEFLSQVSLDRRSTGSSEWIPEFPNIDLFFTRDSQEQLGYIRGKIESLQSTPLKNLMMIVMASVTKNASLADDQSPKPYVSKRYPKKPRDAIDLFLVRGEAALSRFRDFSHVASGKVVGVGNDARTFDSSLGPISMAVTSPPYINAFDYVRSLKLENYWLGLVTDEEIAELRRGSIGTESVPREVTIDGLPDQLKAKISDIASSDPKRSRVVASYFNSMKENMRVMSKNLESGARYVMVVADSTIRGHEVSTSNFLQEIAETEGFEYENKFGYRIRNRYLRFPRSGRGGLMDVDWVMTLKKRG